MRVCICARDNIGGILCRDMRYIRPNGELGERRDSNKEFLWKDFHHFLKCRVAIVQRAIVDGCTYSNASL